MKSLVSALAVLAFLLPVAPAAAAEPPPETVGERMPPERLQLKVVRVYSATDGAALFRAYVVKWKDQEVVVSDTLVRTDYKVGDEIPVLAMNHPFPRGQEPHRLLSFTVVPEPAIRR